MTASLSRRYRFSASHRLHTDLLSETENREVFGKCNNPFGHGHNYDLWVTVHGPVDPQTGVIVSLQLLDQYVAEQVLSRFANRNINQDIEEFEGLVPTTENLTFVLARILEQGWRSCFGAGAPSLDRVYIQETARNSFELSVNVSKEGAGAAELIEQTLSLR
jgi:6-pyruvoyltetrahydropterin/6-carboxytetrahydropterin synthase